MGKTAVAIELSESERRELGGLVSRRKTAQGLAQRARITWRRGGWRTKTFRCGWRLRPTPWASGDGGSRSVASMVSTTNPVRARRASVDELASKPSTAMS